MSEDLQIVKKFPYQTVATPYFLEVKTVKVMISPEGLRGVGLTLMTVKHLELETLQRICYISLFNHIEQNTVTLDLIQL